MRMQKHFPKAKPIELFALIISSRQGVRYLRPKLSLNKNAPVYGLVRMGASIVRQPYAFSTVWISASGSKNTDLMLTQHTGGGARPRKLSVKMADALLNFMKKGAQRRSFCHNGPLVYVGKEVKWC